MSELLKDPGVGLALARLSRERDRIIWPGREPIWAGGLDGGRFTPEQMRELLARGFADGLERQNDGPTIDAALCFAESMPGVELRGYVVAFSRRDRRVTVDAVQWEGAAAPDARARPHERRPASRARGLHELCERVAGRLDRRAANPRSKAPGPSHLVGLMSAVHHEGATSRRFACECGRKHVWPGRRGVDWKAKTRVPDAFRVVRCECGAVHVR